MDDTFELRAGALRLALRPDLGGCIAGLWHGDAPVLRSTAPHELSTSRASACYPLAPYSNRLGHRQFDWQGRSHTVAANVDDSPHGLHGVAWQRAWHIESASAVEVVLRLTHEPDAHWPFAFTLRQFVTLTPQHLRLHLQATAGGPGPQPMGLGWHPYFAKRARSRLHVEVAGRWETDADLLPTGLRAQLGIDADVVHLDFDHCFEGWRGAARIRDERFSMRLSSSLDRLVVFTPRDRPYFCVEPVSHVNNAINMDDPTARGLQTLEPGQAMDAWMQLDVEAL